MGRKHFSFFPIFLLGGDILAYNQNLISFIDTVLLEATAKALQIELKGDFQSLRVAAEAYINLVEYLSETYQSIGHKTTLAQKISAWGNYMHDSEEYSRMMLRLTHFFEERLNAFLGRTVYLAYIDKDGNFSFLDQAQVETLYQKAKKSDPKKARGTIRGQDVPNLNQLPSELKEKMNQSIALRQPVFAEAMRRYGEPAEPPSSDGKKYKAEENLPNTFYWWVSKNRLHHNESNVVPSRIKEAYAEIVINETPETGVGSQSFLNRPSLMDTALMILDGYIESDWIEPAVREDIVKIDSNGDIQFSIKSTSKVSGVFHSAGIRPYLRLAYNILSMPRDLTEQEFKKYLPGLIKLDSVSNLILQAIETNIVPRALEQQLGELYRDKHYNFYKGI